MTPMLCASILQAVLCAAVADEPVAAPKAAPAATANAKDASQANAPAIAGTEQAAAKADTYDEAHRITTETGKPMVVMVGTEWCGPCQMMKKKILPRVREMGLLKKVAFAVVNADRDRELAQSLTGGGPIPQLVMFRKTPEGWMRRKLVGGQTVESVEEFINEGLSLDKGEHAVENAPPKNDEPSTPTPDKTTTHQPDAVEIDESA
jgi:thioredoxin-like negative regulator of GroEL